MKRILSDDDRTQLDQLITEAEKRTKTQIVLATVERSDSYAEIPWKAFASAASITGLLVFLLNLLFTGWLTDILVIISIAAPLAAGILCASLTLLLPVFARLFISPQRAETETQQYAKSLFLEREMFATDTRSGIMVLVSHFERQVVILPDKGLSSRLDKEALKEIIARMSQPLANNDVRLALETGLDGLINVLEPSATSGPVNDELSDEIIEREGV